MKHDFSKTLIRCSALGTLFTQPRDAEAKKRGDLSDTAKGYLLKVYAAEKYDRVREYSNKYTDKGNVAEDTSIDLVNLVDGKKYVKNTERITNAYLSGHPDIIDEDEGYIIDIKSSYDLESFLPNIGKPLNKDYFYQIQGYFALKNIKRGDVRFCLVDVPEHIIKRELFYLLNRMDVATDESDEYKTAAASLEYSMRFGDIDPKERMIKFPVERDNNIIIQIYDKVERARKWLEEFQDLHLSAGETTVTLT